MDNSIEAMSSNSADEKIVRRQGFAPKLDRTLEKLKVPKGTSFYHKILACELCGKVPVSGNLLTCVKGHNFCMDCGGSDGVCEIPAGKGRCGSLLCEDAFKTRVLRQYQKGTKLQDSIHS